MAKRATGSAKLSGPRLGSILDTSNSSRIELAVKNLVGKQGITLNEVMESPVVPREINSFKNRFKKLKPEEQDILTSDESFIRDNLTTQEYNSLAARIGKGNSQVGKDILESLDMKKIKSAMRTASQEDVKAVLDLLGTKTSMGYKGSVQKDVSVEDIRGKAKPKSKPKSKALDIKSIDEAKPKRVKDQLKKRMPESLDIKSSDEARPRRLKDRVKKLKEREEAPYGRKKDGTPKQKPGRKPKTKRERDIEAAVEIVIGKFPPGVVDIEELEEDIEKGVEAWIDWAPDSPITPQELVEILDNSPEKIDAFANNPPKPGQTPKEVYEEREKERKEKPITPEDIEKAKTLTPREKKMILEKLESGEDLDDDFIDWLERKLRRRIKPLPNFDDLNYSPEDWIKRAYAHSTNKDKVATENWFKCARIEFGLNVPRLPVLIELAKRVADEDPNLLFEPRTEINLWYNVWGWQRADDLISNLESVSGLRADESIKAYEDVDERNEKIRRYYANRLRYNLRQDLIDQGWTDRKERDKKLAQMMRERGYKY